MFLNSLGNKPTLKIKGDGIFDKLSNKDALQTIWNTALNSRYKDVHDFCGRAVENLMRETLTQRSLDNITVVMLGLKNLKSVLFPKNNKAPSQDSSAFKSSNSTDTSGQKSTSSNIRRNPMKGDMLKTSMQHIIELSFNPDRQD